MKPFAPSSKREPKSSPRPVRSHPRGPVTLSDLDAANRVIATADLVAVPEVATDDDGDPLRCDDCGRRMAYDYRSDEYRHLVDPEHGCFLIPAR